MYAIFVQSIYIYTLDSKSILKIMKCPLFH
jgi:hypothetical protein